MASDSKDLQTVLLDKINEGFGSFSVVAPLSYIDKYTSKSGDYYHFQAGAFPVSAFGYIGKWAAENLDGKLCRVTGELRASVGKEGGKAFVNLSADSIVKVWLG